MGCCKKDLVCRECGKHGALYEVDAGALIASYKNSSSDGNNMRCPLHVFALLSTVAALASLFLGGFVAAPEWFLIGALAWLLSASAGWVERMINQRDS